MSEVVFLLEEDSARELLTILLPRIHPAFKNCRYVVFEGKQDLESQMVRRMRGYRVPGARFVILRDQDAADCREVKLGLKHRCGEANHAEAIVRIACRELESWYLADLAAVGCALNRPALSGMQNRRAYRAPDQIVQPSRVLKRIVPAYQKRSGSRAIAPHLDLTNGRSRSFEIFVSTMRRLAEDLSAGADVPAP